MARGQNASPDGRFLYLTQQTALVRLDLETRAETVVVSDSQPGGRYGTPIISPDGGRLAYLWTPPGARWSESHLRITEIESGETRTIVPDVVADPQDWFPDGSALLLGDDDGPGLLVLDLTSARSRRIAPPELLDGVPGAKVSPDGRWVVWEGDWKVYITSIDRGRPSVLTTAEHSIGPLWSPDGRYVLYVADHEGTLDLWAVPVTDGVAQSPPTRLLSRVGQVRSLVMTPSGDVLHVRYGNRSDVFEIGLDPEALRLRGDPKPLLGPPSRSAAWSPDGRHVAYVTRKPIPGDPPRQSTWRPAIRDLRTGIDRIIDLGAEWGRFYPAAPRWSTDGGRVLFSDPNRGVYLTDPETGQGHWLVQSAGETREGFHAIGWLEDGVTVVYAHSVGDNGLWPADTHDLTIVARDTRTGDERVLWRGHGAFDPSVSRLSHDRGRITLVESFDTEEERAASLSILSLGDGKRQEIFRSSAPYGDVTWWAANDWLPDDRHLLITRYGMPEWELNRAAQESQFWAVPATGGPPIPMGSVTLVPGDEGFGARRTGIHPSGDRIYFTSGGSYKETWRVRGIGRLLWDD